MTLSPNSSNLPSDPIAAEKHAVRVKSRGAVAGLCGGVVGGVILGFLSHSLGVFFICLIIGLVIVGINVYQLKKILNKPNEW